jgi:hypothetical protein
MCVQGPCQEEWRVSTREEARQEEHGLELMKLGRKHGLELMELTRKEARQAASSSSSSSSLWHLPSYLVSYRLHMVDIGSG